MRPHYSITTQPAFEPISYDQAASHLRVDSTDDMADIDALISVAREYVDSVTGRVSGVTSFKLIGESWDALAQSMWRIPLFRAPLVAVQSVKYYPEDGSAQVTMSASDYRVITAMEPGMVELKEEPPALDERADAVEINFTAGHSESCAIPAAHRHAVKVLVAHLYENRGLMEDKSVNEIPFSLQTLLNNQKIGGWIA